MARGCEGKPNEFYVDSSDILTAMANSSRIAILDILLRLGEVSVGALSERIGLSQSALSQHLAKLRAANLVTTRRDAQTIYYSTKSEAVRRILEMLNEIANPNPPDPESDISQV